MEFKHTREELLELQALPLADKIALAKLRIVEWYEHYEGKVCVSYSGGKDSTVLLKIVREIYPDVPAVYVDTRLDFPEVRDHVKQTANVIWLKPEMNFREVIDKFGYCYPGKEVAELVKKARRGSDAASKNLHGMYSDGSPYPWAQTHFTRWAWLIDAPFKISDECCKVMKEKPLAKYQRETGQMPYTGLTTAESRRRTMAWLKVGCNSFRTGLSKPLSVWTEQDILRYIVQFNVKIPTVYGDIVDAETGTAPLFGYEYAGKRLTTSGEKRTGCIFCPIGSHLDKPNRFQRMKSTHPALYRYCMNELGLDEFLTAVGVPH